MSDRDDFEGVWDGLARALSAWEDEFGVGVALTIVPQRWGGRSDIIAEVSVYDREGGPGDAVTVVGFPLRALTEGAPIDHLAGVVFLSLAQVEADPRLWTRKMRRDRLARGDDPGGDGRRPGRGPRLAHLGD